MALALPEGHAATVEFYPPTLAVAASAVLFGPGNAPQGALVVAQDDLAASVAALEAPTELTLSVTVGALVAGRGYWWASPSTGAAGEVVLSETDGSAAVLESPPPGNPDVGDTLSGHRLTVTVPVQSTRGRDYRIEWTITDADGNVTVERQILHIVRAVFRPAVSPADAARFVAARYPTYGAGSQMDAGHYRVLAQSASERVAQLVERDHRYTDLMFDPKVFRLAGQTALRLELAHDGHYPAGDDLTDYLKVQEDQLQADVATAIASTPYDSNDDGVQSELERPQFASVSLVRR